MECLNAVLGEFFDECRVGGFFGLLGEEWVHDGWPDELDRMIVTLKAVSFQEILDNGLSIRHRNRCLTDVQILDANTNVASNRLTDFNQHFIEIIQPTLDYKNTS